MQQHRYCHWCFKTARPFEPGMTIGKGEHEQIACGVPLRSPKSGCIEINFVRGIYAMSQVDCPECCASLAFKQTRQRMAEGRPYASIRGYQVVVSLEVKDYEEARELALQAKQRGWKVELHEVVRPQPVIQRHRLWSSEDGVSPA